MTMQRIAVIGGGLAGLTVALRRMSRGDVVTVFEANATLGGQLVSEEREGFVIEHGAEGFVARSEAVPALARDLGIFEDLIDQLTFRSFSFDRGTLVALAPGEAGRMLGFQVASDELGRGIRAFRHGMGELPARIVQALDGRAELLPNSPVTRVAPHEHGVIVTLSHGAERTFDAAVIASPARAAAAMLGDAFGEPARELARATLTSSLTVSLAYRADQIEHALDGTGFIVPKPEELFGVRAVTFVSSKLPHRAPEGHALLRAFFRPSLEDLPALSDDAWTKRAAEGLALALSISGSPQRSWVSRWHDALPVFDDAHRARVTALESSLAGTRILLAGSAFHGSGIDAAVRSAERTTEVLSNH